MRNQSKITFLTIIFITISLIILFPLVNSENSLDKSISSKVIDFNKDISINKEYNKSQEKIQIKIKEKSEENSLMELELLENTDLCSKDCYAIINITNYEDEIKKNKNKEKGSKENSIIESLDKNVDDFGIEYKKLNNLANGIKNVNYYIADNSTNYNYELINYPEDIINKTGNYLLKIEAEKYLEQNNNIDWVLSIYGLELNEWAVWYSPQYVYDEINDSIVNQSLWTNSSYSSPNSYVSEDANNLNVVISSNTGGYYASAETNNFPSINRIENITMNVRFYTAGGQCGTSDSWNGYFTALGTNLFSSELGGVSTCEQYGTIQVDDTSVWTFIRNDSLGTNFFDVYDDGIYNRTISASNNIFKLSFGLSHVQSGTSNLNGYFGYIYYTERDILQSNISEPANDSMLAYTPIDIICNSSSTLGKLENITLNVWNQSDNTLVLTNTTNITGTSNSTTFSTDLVNGTYSFNCLVFNDEGTSTWDETGNRTFILNTELPNIVINSIPTTTGSQTAYFNTTITDSNLDKCKFTIYNSTGGVDGTNENVSFACSSGISTTKSFTVTLAPPQTFTLRIYANDTTSNEAYQDQNFTIAQIVAGEGGSGGAGVVTQRIEAENFDITSINFLKNLDISLAKDSVRQRTKYFYITNKGSLPVNLNLICDTTDTNESTRNISICDYVEFNETNIVVSPNENDPYIGELKVLTPENSSIKDEYYFNILAISPEGTNEYYSKLSVSTRVSFLAYAYKWSYLLDTERIYPVALISFIVALSIWIIIFIIFAKKKMEVTGAFLGLLLFGLIFFLGTIFL